MKWITTLYIYIYSTITLKMGMAKLNIWVSAVGDPCKASDKTWYINIYNCDGYILEWCKKRYSVIPAECGHVEVELPPGKYVINAVWGYWIDAHDVIHGNHFTHNAIVHAICEKTTCVTLFTPKAHICGTIFMLAMADLVRQDLIPKLAVNNLEKAMGEVLRHLPEPPKLFELDALKDINKVAKRRIKTES